MEKKYDVVALGELLIDFTENGLSSQGNPLMEANPGGAPCNVLAMLNKLGKKTAFIGKVGRDQFGTMLKTVVEESGTDVTNLMMDDEVHTTLAFVHTCTEFGTGGAEVGHAIKLMESGAAAYLNSVGTVWGAEAGRRQGGTEQTVPL